MSDVVHDAQHEFWRPPVVAAEAARAGHGGGLRRLRHRIYGRLAFLPRLRGCSRGATSATAATGHSTCEFQNIKRTLGLSIASLVAFRRRMACLLMAGVAVGMIYSVQTFNDFQAVHSYRMQWLLGAIAAFAAGLLLKKSPDSKR